jgi:hypothetical protein
MGTAAHISATQESRLNSLSIKFVNTQRELERQRAESAKSAKKKATWALN